MLKWERSREKHDFDAYKLHKTKKEEWEDFECTLLTIGI